jgi:WD40 repeat protein
VDLAVSKCSKAGHECYAVTADGFLLSFDAERNLDKWVDVKSSAFSISVTDTHIACACADGIVRLFNAPTLEYISTLPRPPPFRPAGTTLQTNDSDAAAGGAKRAASAPPNAIAVQMTTDNQRAGCIYSDRSFFVWDLRDVTKVCRCRAMHAHSGSIWDLDFLPSPAAQRAGLPPDSFVTCGSDSTIRIWGLAPRDGSKHETTAEGGEGSKRPVPFKDLRAMVVCSEWGVDAVDGNTGGGIRCIKVSPDGARVASGDRMGNLRVHTLSNGMHMEMETFLEAHDAEILSIDYGGQDGNLLASAARDRLIHVFDVNRNYDTLCTLDEHAAAVTSVRFAARGTRLISCGGDKRMIFRTLLQPPDKCTQTHNAYLRVDASLTQNVPLGTVYDVCVDRAGRLALSAGQDNGLIVWEVATGTKKRRYTTDCECTLRVRLDPTGMFAATTSSDKAIRLHDFHSGDLVCIAHGHSEPVTAVAFAPSLDRLVSASGDGCIFVWQLPAAVARSMLSRQSELHSSCESILSVASILSTPREGCERVSGAGVFAVSPLKQNGKAAKPTISDLKKITLKSDGSNDDRTEKDELVARNAIVSQRSMLSALLDETLDASKKKDHTSSVLAMPPSDPAAVTNKQIDASSTNSTSAAPLVKKDNWMQSAERQHKDAPALAILSGGVGGGGGGGGDAAKKRELRRVVEADLVVSEIEGHGIEQGQNVGSVIESSVAITADTAVSDADEDDKSGSELQVLSLLVQQHLLYWYKSTNTDT